MEELTNLLIKNGFKGEIDDRPETLEFYSHDASMFEIKPKLIVRPTNSTDVEKLVIIASHLKNKEKNLSLTARSAGTCMSGGAINDSVIVDFQKHFNKIEGVSSIHAKVQPGVFYRDFEPATLKHGALMPSYPASRDLASVGGMVNNNSGGEKSLEFGKTENFINSLNVVFADGKERLVKPLSYEELNHKIAKKDFEGKVYRQLHSLINKNYDFIKDAKPNVTKNSTGYNLWDVWDKQTGIFDICKLIVGAQGTLGFVTDINFKLVRHRPHSGLLVLFLRDIDNLGEIINTVLSYKPATFESFDDATLYLALRFMPSFLKMLGLKRFIHLIITLIPDALQLIRGIPKLILMVEFNGETENEVRQKIVSLHKELSPLKAKYEINGFEEDPSEAASEKFWIMRRYSFQLLRSKVKDKHTAPFIDDFVVPPKYLSEFLPKLRSIIKKYKLNATIAGHMGDGNFHVIPLMKLEDNTDRKKIMPVMRLVNNLVLKYHGSLSGEHNDGLVRGPWLEFMYGHKMMSIFKETKDIFDPESIFNPHKKVTADWDYSFSHIREHF